MDRIRDKPSITQRFPASNAAPEIASHSDISTGSKPSELFPKSFGLIFWSPRILRVLLFLWVIAVACPIRYWPINDSIDNTWVFALNYAAAHGVSADLVWTTGPLGYLVFPMDLGHNLAQALVFQGALWMALIAIFADLFFRVSRPLRNLAFFSILFALSSPLFWFNYMGLENLMLAGVLVLLVLNRQYGGPGRFVAALVLAGMIALIKLTGGMIACGALAGFLLDRIVRLGWKRWTDLVLAALIPFGITVAGLCLFLSSPAQLPHYLIGSFAIVSGYSAAMSSIGGLIAFAVAAEILIALGAFLFWETRSARNLVWFLATILVIPILLSIKHGFVRQDIHVINFFFFVSLSLGVASIMLPLHGRRSMVAFLVLLNCGMISLVYMWGRVGWHDAMTDVTGSRGLVLAREALFGPGGIHLHPLDFAGARAALNTQIHYAPEYTLEPEVRVIVGNAPVASLSMIYSGSVREGLNLQLYPVPQRYSAYTPYLDQLNAAWIRDHGPRFLVFDGTSIDGRQFWAETPAMWIEVYRWYNTNILGSRTLLLERRSAPRFGSLRVMPAQQIVSPERGFALPANTFTGVPAMDFWSLRCGASAVGAIENLVLRVPPVIMRVENSTGASYSARVIVPLLSTPILGSSLPRTLADLASLMSAGPITGPIAKPIGTTIDRTNAPAAPVRKITFGGSGVSAYSRTCALEFLTPE
jgi:hypothetical protein